MASSSPLSKKVIDLPNWSMLMWGGMIGTSGMAEKPRARSTLFRPPPPVRTFEKVIWLQSPPWARWAAALVIAAVAIWIEIRPEPTILHPFAIEDIDTGALVDGANTEMRPVPADMFSPVELGRATASPVSSGDPVLASGLDQEAQRVPDGWWSLEVALPSGAHRGDSARIVLLDSDTVAAGVVVEETGEDPLGSGLGLVAVDPEKAAEIARAVGEGRAVVMIAPP